MTSNKESVENMETLAEDATAATQMIENESFNKAFDTMNTNIINQMMSTPPEAHEERERLYMMFKSGQVFVQQLAALINNYDLAKQREDV